LAKQASAAQSWSAAVEKDRAAKADLAIAMQQQLEAMRGITEQVDGDPWPVRAESADTSQNSTAGIDQRSADYDRLESEIASVKTERDVLERGLRALECVADQRLAELSAINAHVEALDRQLTDARQAIDVFEQWFSRLQALPVGATDRGCAPAAANAR